MKRRQKNILGWIGVSVTIAFSSFWAYWGSFENFHEGWYSESLLENLLMFFFQYMIFTLLFILLAVITLRWKKIGLILHLLLGAFCIYFFSDSSFHVLGLLIILPFLLLGIIYYVGEPTPKRWAYRLIIMVPLLITLAISLPLGIRVSQRVNDQDFSLRIIQENGVSLAWAPRGPGWPDRGVSWEEAQEICQYLSEDGLSITEEVQNIWRLPSVEEAVRSMMIHGESAEGSWDPIKQKAHYKKTPDKETPLWDLHSQIIYYWTSETSIEDPNQAYIIVYDGGVYDKRKSYSQNYQSFRAVKAIL